MEQVFLPAISPTSVPPFTPGRGFIISAKFLSIRHLRILRDLPVFCDYGPEYEAREAIMLDYESVLGRKFTQVVGNPVRNSTEGTDRSFRLRGHDMITVDTSMDRIRWQCLGPKSGFLPKVNSVDALCCSIRRKHFFTSC